MAGPSAPFPKVALDGGCILPLIGGSAYIYGTLEERSEKSVSAVSGDNCRFIFMKELGESRVAPDGNSGAVIDFRIHSNIEEFVKGIDNKYLYIDITGLGHDVWAPLLKESLRVGKEVFGVYMEPDAYTVSPNPFGADLYDLSERIEGIKPIPGFARFQEFDDEAVPFIPLLGFEGARFAFVLEHMQPSPDRIFPVIGVPGFRIEYPFTTYQGNQTTLLSTKCWRNVRYVPASCPFGVFQLLEKFSREHDFIRVAPIGTKPHALGALLYATINSSSIEVVYDHPKRKKNRSSGVGRRHVYNISEFLRIKY